MGGCAGSETLGERVPTHPALPSLAQGYPIDLEVTVNPAPALKAIKAVARRGVTSAFWWTVGNQARKP